MVEGLQEENRGVDILVYPIVATYRHGIELSLKYLRPLFAAICDETPSFEPTHRLMDNWRFLRNYLEKLGDSIHMLDSVEAKLEDFVNVDPSGQVFRYPSDRDGRLHLQDLSLINIAVFGDEMELLAQFFEGCFLWAQHEFQDKCEFEVFRFEIEREFEQEMRDWHGFG